MPTLPPKDPDKPSRVHRNTKADRQGTKGSSTKRTGWATPKDKEMFWALVKAGWRPNAAAKELGFSSGWATNQMKNVTVKEMMLGKPTEVVDGKVVKTAASGEPSPKAWDDLSTDAREALRDFNVFSELFFARRPMAWRKEAADRVAAMLLDKSTINYVDINTPPGAGKTTCFTHDIPLWLLCGGGSLDPGYGRALRGMLGSRTKNVARHYVSRLRRSCERQGKFYDKAQKREALLSIIEEFGYFKPKPNEGDVDAVWRAEEFVVAQLSGVDLYEMEPTIQAASRESGFLGERVDFYSWDDLATKENSNNARIAKDTAEWFEDEAETRLEPGGVGLLVGQRLSNLDLHRNRLDTVWIDDDGVERKRYEHIIYPAHFDDRCDGTHRQYTGTDGCLLDAERLPWRTLRMKQEQGNYRTVYQQEDSDPESVLVQQVWIDGGEDLWGYPAPGCKDKDRGFWEWPRDPDTGLTLPGLITYATVDPSVTNWWAIEVKAIDPKTMHRYLIAGFRQKMQSGDFLDYSIADQKHIGLMEELQVKSGDHGHPIAVWVIEANAAHRYLFQNEAYRSWRRKWPNVTVMPHDTQRNKQDEDLGVFGLLPGIYREGINHLPWGRGDLAALNYVRVKIKELTTYPATPTYDTVMTEWFGESNIEAILRLGRGLISHKNPSVPSNLPPYLARQRREVAINA